MSMFIIYFFVAFFVGIVVYVTVLPHFKKGSAVRVKQAYFRLPALLDTKDYGLLEVEGYERISENKAKLELKDQSGKRVWITVNRKQIEPKDPFQALCGEDRSIWYEVRG